MTVLIKEMWMPERCEECPFFVVFHVKRMGVCLAHNPQSGIDEKRKPPKPDWCPLEEQEEIIYCKDCKHWDAGENESDSWSLCTAHFNRYYAVSESDYCSFGEREDGFIPWPEPEEVLK